MATTWWLSSVLHAKMPQQKKRHKNNLIEFCLLMEYAMRQAHLKLISSHFIAYHTTTLDSLTMFIFTHSRDYLGYLAGCLWATLKCK